MIEAGLNGACREIGSMRRPIPSHTVAVVALMVWVLRVTMGQGCILAITLRRCTPFNARAQREGRLSERSEGRVR